MPPALVASMPPIWHEPRAPRSTPNVKPAASAASCTVCSGVPARTVIVPAAASSASMPAKRSIDSTTSPPSATAPRASPVSPPCGTTGWPSRMHSASARDTSSTLRGRTSARGRTPAGSLYAVK